MLEKARYATAHWLRFQDVTTPDQLLLSGKPPGALSWKIGPCGPVGPNGYRLPSNIWCAVGLFRELAVAKSAFDGKHLFIPFVSNATESWHQLLLPIRHHGECNHLDGECPGELFDVSSTDPGGPVMVITTAGFRFGPELKMERVIEFRRNVDLIDNWIQQAEGCLASKPFTPHTLGDDGFTMSVWRDDGCMLNAAYRAGAHRTQIDRHKSENVFDRSSFTRFRILDACGRWNGKDPMASS
jgi:hypothetical protein